MTFSEPTDYEIREALAADIPAIVDVWWEFMMFHANVNPTFTPTPEGRESFSTHLGQQVESKNSLLLVADSSGAIIGYCLAGMAERPPVLLNRDYGMIDDLAVTGDMRRRGVGEALLKATESWFENRGVRRVELQVVTANEVASRFWAKMGYVKYMERRYREV
jgi:GNAT superfamily N-acetyltransferase